jgi:hypothetical protein
MNSSRRDDRKFTPDVGFNQSMISVLILASVTVKIDERINQLRVDYALQEHVTSLPVPSKIRFVCGDNKDRMNDCMLTDS